MSHVPKKFVGLHVHSTVGSIEPRRRSGPKRKYSLNEAFFENIDTEEKAYWLGFIYADGCISNNRLQFDLSWKDNDHLAKLACSLGTDTPVKFKKRENHEKAFFRVVSRKLINDLKRLGLTERKSFTIKFPSEDLVAKEYQHHFIRGYVDGDGSFIVRPRKDRPSNSYTFKVIGSTAFIQALQNIMIDQGLSKTKLEIYKSDDISKTIATMTYCGRLSVAKVFNFLYGNETMCLSRKKMIASQSINVATEKK